MTGHTRFFNTAGPVKPTKHYHVPPLSRLDMDDLLQLLRQEKYFVLHAPRQTGKTSALLALRDRLNAGEDFRCVYVNVEVGQSSREDVGAAMRAILSALARGARHSLDDRFVAGIWREVLEEAGPHDALGETLARWAESDARPLVLLIDEIDALVGDSLVSVLRQLRAGYPERPGRFPQNVILCGIRDVRDYRIHSSSGREIIAGGSAFNIRAESLRLGDFSRSEVGIAPGAAPRAHRSGVHGRRPRGRLGADPRAAVAGERPCLRRLFPRRGPVVTESGRFEPPRSMTCASG